MTRRIVLMLAALTVGVGLIGALRAQSAPAAPATYKLDGVHSMVIFRIKHLGVSYTYGRFNDVSGTVKWAGSNPAGASFDVTIKAASVDTNEPRRDQHLRGPDFFDAKQFPTIRFKSTNTEAGEGGAFKLTGNLTLHGVTQPITVTFQQIGEGKDPWGGYRAGFESTFKIKRSDFGMTKILNAAGDEVTLMVSLEGIRK